MGRIEEALRKAKVQRQGVLAGQSIDISRNPERATLRVAKKVENSAVTQWPAHSHTVRFDNERLREQRVIAASQNDERVAPYRQLRTQLLKMMQDNHWMTLAITSPNEGAGKSLTATNLAISLSRVADIEVLLVDLDLMTPSIHKKLSISPKMGLVDFLEGKAGLEDILFDPGISSLSVLIGRSAGRNASELLASPRMHALMNDLCQRDEGNITIFDLPPLLRNDDAILFAPYADATLVVVEEGVTTEDQLRQSIQLLQKANFIGTVFNKVRS